MRERNILVLAGGLLASLLSGCSFENTQPEMLQSISDSSHLPSDAGELRTYTFNGEITQESVSAVLSELGQIDRIRITSEGGDMMAAIRLSEHLNKHEITVEISQYCFSACAHFIALPANILEIDGQPIIGFHHTSGSILARAVRPLMLEYERFQELNEALTFPQVEYYRSLGIDQRWLFEPDARTTPRCTFIGIVQDPGAPMVRYKNDYDFFVPSYRLLDQMYPQRSSMKFDRDLEEEDFSDFKRRNGQYSNTSFLLSTEANVTVTVEFVTTLQKLPLC